MIFQKHRYQVWNSVQHPYKHTLDELPFFHPALPPGAVFNARQAMEWLFAVLYPNTKDPVDTPLDLPLVGNTLNDYRVVLDDGDGKAASYRWEQREGDVAPKWYKIYDMDWGEDSILSNFLIKTQDVYVFRYGHDDTDENGDPLVGDLAGQFIYGGASANTHLTLYANSGDGVGPNTGYIQFGDDSRPLLDNTFSLGTLTYRFANIFSVEANLADFTITDGSIVSASPDIDFGTNNLTTDGSITSDTLTISGGSIVDTTGDIDFGATSLTTTGDITANSVSALGAPSAFASGSTIGDVTIADGSIVSAGGEIDFGANDLTTTGDITGDSGTLTDLTIGRMFLSDTVDPTISTSASDLYINPFDSLQVLKFANFEDGLQVNQGNVEINDGFLYVQKDYIQLGPDLFLRDTNVIETDNNESLAIKADSGTIVIDNSSLVPSVTDFRDLGSGLFRWDNLYLANDISDGTDAITMPTLLSLRDINVGVGVGFSLFWTGTKWEASLPDTEIDHSTISGLLGDDHPQYLHLPGRAGGQTVYGGTDAGDDLFLSSTTHATLGNIIVASDVIPDDDDTFNLGSSTRQFLDLYMSGEGRGFRAENFVDFASFPAASASSIGRLAYDLDGEDLYVDVGGTWKRVSLDTYYEEDSVNWDGTAFTHTYDVSAEVTDARKMIWQFKDNADDFAPLLAKITTPSATQVTVYFLSPPPASTYTLVGIGL